MRVCSVQTIGGCARARKGSLDPYPDDATVRLVNSDWREGGMVAAEERGVSSGFSLINCFSKLDTSAGLVYTTLGQMRGPVSAAGRLR